MALFGSVAKKGTVKPIDRAIGVFISIFGSVRNEYANAYIFPHFK